MAKRRMAAAPGGQTRPAGAGGQARPAYGGRTLDGDRRRTGTNPAAQSGPVRPRPVQAQSGSVRPRSAQAQSGSARPRPVPAQGYDPQEARAQKKKVRHFYDYSLLFSIIFLTAFGLVMIYSASSYSAQLDPRYGGNGAYFMQRQGAIAAVGFVVLFIVSKMDYHFFAKFSVLGYVMSYVLMIAVSLVGTEANGKKRWLGIGPVSFQPTEFVKIALILMLAAVITSVGHRINRPKTALSVAALALPLAGLIAMNNLSSGIIVCGIVFVMLFVACKVKWPFFAMGAAAGGILAGAGPIGNALLQIGLLKPYQFNRIEAWLNPESDPTGNGFQVLQGLYAIGSGGLVGQGLGESIQKLGFLPESQNDMIFAIICEELGLFGAVSIILIFLFMIYRFMVIANNAPDLFGAMLVVGVMGHIAIQVILNIAVVTNTIPNTGITLPFISYGGTSILFLLVEMGMVLSVSNQIKLEK